MKLQRKNANQTHQPSPFYSKNTKDCLLLDEMYVLALSDK